MTKPSSLQREISPPKILKRKRTSPSLLSATSDVKENENCLSATGGPSSAAIEAGQAKIQDHLAYFTEHLKKASTPASKIFPRLSIERFSDFYQRNQHPHGHHFVVHQHNHPIAKVHYDLRLQFSQSSSMSFALPYGLPGNPNSQRQGRMAIETRVHNLWNHLVESASHATGSLLIWDTGEYSILPRKRKAVETDDEFSETASNTLNPPQEGQSDNERLIEAFQSRYIRLRLHGTRLPPNYTITLRLPSANDTPSHAPITPRKRRRKTSSASRKQPVLYTDSDSDSSTDLELDTTSALAIASENGASDSEAAVIRTTNAYIGATNSIGSVHQRRWFVTLDRRNSGFAQLKHGQEKGRWVRDAGGGFETFFVLGAEVERSVVTGRLAREVESDEGVQGFFGRGIWRPVLE